MARGNITRIVGGKNSVETEEWIVYTDQFTAYAGKGSHFTADEGTSFGNPKEAPLSSKHFLEGYWTDSENNRITEAKVGDPVKFYIILKDIGEDELYHSVTVDVQLTEYNEMFFLWMSIIPVPTKNTKVDIVIANGDNKGDKVKRLEIKKRENKYKEYYASIDIVFGDELNDWIMEGSEMGSLEFFMECDYIYDNQDLPFEKNNYLKLKVSDRTLFISPAVEGYILPEFYTQTGETIIFALGDSQAKEDPSHPQKKLDDAIDGITGESKEILIEKTGEVLIDKVEETLDNLRYYLAARELRSGKIAMNTGEIITRKNAMYNHSIYNNEGTALFNIKKASNFGYKKAGQTVTSKGINQLEYFANKGITKLIPKMGKQVIGIAGGLMSSADDWQNFTELITMMTDGKPANARGIEGLAGVFLPTPVAFAIAAYEATIVADGLRKIDEMLQSINEKMEVGFHNAKSKGIEEVKKYLETSWAKSLDDGPFIEKYQDRTPRVTSIEVYLPVLIKLLQGKVRNITQLINLNEKQELDNFELYKKNQTKPSKYFVVYRNIKNKNEKIQDLYGYNTIIESIFCIDEEQESNSIFPSIDLTEVATRLNENSNNK